MLCKVFSTTLVRFALFWFHQLPEKSISFEDFCTLFIRKYASNRRKLKTMRDLHKMKQMDDETP